MILEPLNSIAECELVVTPVGNAMLLYRGALRDDLIWAQYDDASRRVQLVAEDGAIQDLGFEVSAAAVPSLMKTREVFITELDENAKIKGGRLIKFIGVGE